MSHAHESEQSISRHEPLPEHVTLHLPWPHSSSRHEPLPLHTTVHDKEFEQSMPDVHEFVVLQPIVQFHPDGHTTSSLQLVVAQSMMHSLRSKRQLVHCGGQTPASTPPSVEPSGGFVSVGGASIGPLDVTQNPFTHERPGNASQSDGSAHSYSLLL
jgi:hypothetical protein